MAPAPKECAARLGGAGSCLFTGASRAAPLPQFYSFWRRFPFKTARAVELLLAKELDR